MVPIIQRFTPKGRDYGRPGYPLKATSLTIHNTGNESPGADAEAHARYFATRRENSPVSVHFFVDAREIIQTMPTDEQAWHTGTHEGNTTSIGIEVCEYPNTEAGRKLQAIAEDNAAQLAARLLRQLHLGPSAVRTHKSWSGKQCPRDILPRWNGFITKVRRHYKEGSGAQFPVARRTNRITTLWTLTDKWFARIPAGRPVRQYTYRDPEGMVEVKYGWWPFRLKCRLDALD